MFNKLCAALTGLAAVVPPAAALSQPHPPVGVWDCLVNSQQVSIQLRMQVAPNQTLIGRAQIVYAQSGKTVSVQGNGDWSGLPPEPGFNEWLFSFRMFPQDHANFSWFARPTHDPGFLTNTFQNPNGMITQTNCQRVG